MTDGESTDGDLAYRYLPDVARRNITVDLIGLDMSGQHSLAESINGTYKEANDAKSLAKAVQDVLAESSGSSGDAKESDYDLLEGITVEFASAALDALSETNDEVPIGDKPVVEIKWDQSGKVSVDSEGNVVTEEMEVHVSGAPPLGAIVFFACVGLFVLVVVVIIMTIALNGR